MRVRSGREKLPRVKVFSIPSGILSSILPLSIFSSIFPPSLIYLSIYVFSVVGAGELSAQGAIEHPANGVTAAARAKESKPRISAKDAEALFRSVGEVMKFVSKDTGLPQKGEVAKRLVGRDDVEADVSKRLNEDEDSRRLERASVVLKKFRFLPADFKLRDFEVALMREQVAGYYNIKDKTIYLLNWIEAGNQLPIMAHELTHAIQDQNFDLEHWNKPMERDEKAPPDNDADPNEDAIADEQATARVAMVEGQGMAVMIDYFLAPSGKTLLEAGQQVDALKAGMTQNQDSPLLNSAPLYLRESLIFPYREGLTFIQQMLFKSQRKGAFAGTFADPPRTSREILHPEAYFSHEKLAPIAFPKLAATLGKDYQRYDAGAMGEFDVKVFLQQFASEGVAMDLSEKWRGGLYVAELNCKKTKCGKAAVNRSAANADLSTSARSAPTLGMTVKENAENPEIATDAVGLIYLSRWTDAATARQFADEYAKLLLKRYKFAQGQMRATIDPKDAAFASHAWMTDEGLVTVRASGDEVLVLESFDEATAKKISEKVWDMEAQRSTAVNP